MNNSLIKKIMYVFFPVAIFICYLPIVFTMPPFLPKGTTNFSMEQVYVVIPFYLGLLASPGYFSLVFTSVNDPKMFSKNQIVWFRLSLIVGIVATIAGTAISSTIMPPFALCGVIILILLFQLTFKFEKFLKSG